MYLVKVSSSEYAVRLAILEICTLLFQTVDMRKPYVFILFVFGWLARGVLQHVSVLNLTAEGNLSLTDVRQ